MNRYKIFIVISIIISLMMISSCIISIEETQTSEIPLTPYPPKTEIYEEDYIQKYYETLNAMFGKEWEVTSKEAKEYTYEAICSHLTTTHYKYIEWVIEYKHSDGIVQNFTLNNMRTLSLQIETYLEEYIGNFYEEKHLFKDIDNNLFSENGNYVFCFFNWINTNPSEPENKKINEKMGKYMEHIEYPETAVNFVKLTPYNIFEKLPISLSIYVSSNSNGLDFELKKTLEEKLSKQVNSMILEIQDKTNYHLNAEIDISCNQGRESLYDNQKQWSKRIVDGTSLSVGMNFRREVSHIYDGIFWD